MTAVVLGLILSLAILRVVGLVRRRGAGQAAEPVPSVPVSPPPAGPEIASLDDDAFRGWLGVHPAVYDRYVDTGVEDLEIFLADQPVRHIGEGPADPAA